LASDFAIGHDIKLMITTAFYNNYRPPESNFLHEKDKWYNDDKGFDDDDYDDNDNHSKTNDPVFPHFHCPCPTK